MKWKWNRSNLVKLTVATTTTDINRIYYKTSAWNLFISLLYFTWIGPKWKQKIKRKWKQRNRATTTTTAVIIDAVRHEEDIFHEPVRMNHHDAISNSSGTTWHRYVYGTWCAFRILIAHSVSWMMNESRSEPINSPWRNIYKWKLESIHTCSSASRIIAMWSPCSKSAGLHVARWCWELGSFSTRFRFSTHILSRATRQFPFCNRRGKPQVIGYHDTPLIICLQPHGQSFKTLLCSAGNARKSKTFVIAELFLKVQKTSDSEFSEMVHAETICRTFNVENCEIYFLGQVGELWRGDTKSPRFHSGVGAI